jgi:dethiobiotin synthetase
VTPRFYVTGTDTDVGKTVVTAAAARVLRERHGFATIVKIAQTGLRAKSAATRSWRRRSPAATGVKWFGSRNRPTHGPRRAMRAVHRFA